MKSRKCGVAKTGDFGSWQSLGVGCRLQVTGPGWWLCSGDQTQGNGILNVIN